MPTRHHRTVKLHLLTAPPKRFSRTPSLFFLVCVAITGTLPIHLLVPIMAEVAADLNVSIRSIQGAITSYLVGLALGQLFVGPLSDRIGRRPVLVLGLAWFMLGTVGVAVANTLPFLVISRLVQAVGGCAGLALGRTIARETANGVSATKRLSLLAAAMSLGPGFAPLLGTRLSGLVGWRGMFFLLAFAITILLVAALLTLEETHNNRSRLSFRTHAARWVALLKNPRFLGNCVGGAFGTTNFYAIVANAPVVICGIYGFSRAALGLFYLAFVGSLTAGNLFGHAMAERLAQSRVLLTVSFVMTAIPLGLLLEDQVSAIPSTVFILGCVGVCLCIGMCGPYALTASLSADSKAIGAASGLYGSIQMMVGAAVVSLLGALHFKATTATVTVLALAGAISLVAFICAEKTGVCGASRTADVA